MKKKMALLVLITLLAGSRVYAKELTREITDEYLNGSPKEVVYYEDGKEIAEERFDKEGNIIKAKGAIPDGIVKEYDREKRVRAEVSFKNGKREGPTKFYFEDGELKAEQNYKNGKLNGASKFYDEDNHLRLEKNYSEGLLNGPTKEYSETGYLKKETNYRKGVLHGETKIYWENRTVVSVIETYDKGVLVSQKMYDIVGQLISVKHFRR